LGLQTTTPEVNESIERDAPKLAPLIVLLAASRMDTIGKLIVLSVLLIGGCATPRSGRHEPRRTRESFVLMVSNQVPKPDPARIIVSIDGKQVVDGEFEYGQDFPGHTFISHHLELPRGKHTISARTADGNVRFRGETTLKRKKWYVVCFRGDKFTSYESEEPVYIE